MQDDATSRARRAIADELFASSYGGSSGLDKPLWDFCNLQADDAMRGIANAGLALIDTRTHAAVPREPSDEVVERVARAIFDDDWCARDRHGTNAIARAAIAALVQGQTQGGERET